jgi:hypothetical protein
MPRNILYILAVILALQLILWLVGVRFNVHA